MAEVPACVAVAYSAGRDSTALLHAALVEAAARGGVRIVALHVHHGLSRDADAWEAHGRAQCARWSAEIAPVAFHATRLAVDRRPGESLEAWARRRRYRALGDMARAAGAEWVLLAHHRLDQAETLLLQALRGGGLAGLASMPAVAVRDGLVWRRPWLDRTREEIDDYLARHRLEPVVDDTDADRRLDRNRLRAQVWPPLVDAFPAAAIALAGAAARAGEGLALLEEVARADLREVADEGPLVVDRWQGGSPARRSNTLRAWLRREQGSPPPPRLVARLMTELTDRRTGRWSARGGELRLHLGRLAWAPDVASTADAPERASRWVVDAPGLHVVPGWGGAIRVEAVAAGETGLALVPGTVFELRERQGGERFQAAPRRPARSLKKQFQAAGLPAWARGGPLVWRGGQLVFVPGLGLDARAVGVATVDGPPHVRLDWLPEAPPPRPPAEGPGPES